MDCDFLTETAKFRQEAGSSAPLDSSHRPSESTDRTSAARAKKDSKCQMAEDTRRATKATLDSSSLDPIRSGQGEMSYNNELADRIPASTRSVKNGTYRRMRRQSPPG